MCTDHANVQEAGSYQKPELFFAQFHHCGGTTGALDAKRVEDEGSRKGLSIIWITVHNIAGVYFPRSSHRHAA